MMRYSVQSRYQIFVIGYAFLSFAKNIQKTVTNEHDKEIPKERYISPEERQKIIDDLRLI